MKDESSSVDVAEVLDQLRESVRQHQPTSPALPTRESARWRRWELLLEKIQQSELVNPHLPIAWPEWPRGVVPKASALVQKVVRRLLRWYINPIVEQQNTYNQAVTEALSELVTQIKVETEQKNRLEGEVRVRGRRIGVLDQRLRQLETSGVVPAAERTKVPEIDRVPVRSVEPGLDYFLLELKYRGEPELIRERQGQYLDAFLNCRAVLDIGCGRGEFVELLRENQIDARGIDLDPDAVAYCQERGLPVTQAEAIDYLQGLEGGAVDGIFMAQVVEHMNPSALQALFSLAFTKLEPGGIVVAETVNPLCLYALVNHYLIDPSHVQPLHPELLKFMAESAGFAEIQIWYLSPTPEEIRLQQHPIRRDVSDAEQARIRLMNRNVDRVNELLYGYQDYALSATRPRYAAVPEPQTKSAHD